MTAQSVSIQPVASAKPDGVQRGQRVAWADLCRVVAIYGVILIHSCGAAFYAFGKSPLTDWLSANALDSVVRVAVPLFVMISGAMLLKPGMPIATPRDILRRVLKVLIPLIFWSAAHLYRNNALGSYGEGLLTIFTQPAMYHLWFVYMIVGLYLLLPFFQAIYEALRTKPALSVYFFVVWFVITCVPLYWPLRVLGIMQQGSFLGYGGFFILGGLINGIRRESIPRWLCVAVYAACSAITFYLTWRFSEQAGVAVERAYVYFTPNVVIGTIAAFLAFSTIELSGRPAAFFQWLGDRSFIIFFVHVVVLEHVRYSATIRMLTEHLPMFFVILLISLSTFFFSCLIAAVIRLIPGASRVAG
ncbi:acyltransferase family protein [Achromobacter seleniivolatilans]|uniref:Acyltransferase family protein n=1 Tax=Achromobacter seleniivolatilans TaxID=3047478 RepID=A0ABY9LX67_9BURK|nr:acyltransferase family protein [Achromobacter sp. R39]WMD19373.1 acyltransferase family protein [Achromobacter sp. R39]